MWFNELNAGFEAVGALLSWQNARAARLVRPAGVNPCLIAFSALWAVECIPYYLAHGDTGSALCAAARCLAHGVWCWRAWAWRVVPDDIRFGEIALLNARWTRRRRDGVGLEMRP